MAIKKNEETFRMLLDKMNDGLSYSEFKELISFYDSTAFQDAERIIWGKLPQIHGMDFRYKWNHAGMIKIDQGAE